MNVDITGRHIDVTPALREFTEDRLRKLTRLLDGPLDVHVVLGIEKHRHLAEIQVKSRSGVFSGAHETFVLDCFNIKSIQMNLLIAEDA